jgi:hypothetical protein
MFFGFEILDFAAYSYVEGRRIEQRDRVDA